MSVGGNDLEVRFGGNTTDLDNASNKAVNDIKKVGTATNGLGGVFASVKNHFTAFVGGFKQGWNEAGEGAKGAGRETTNFGQIAQEVFAASEGGVMGLAAAFSRLLPVAAAAGAIFGLLKFGAAFGDEAEKLDQMSTKLGMAATEVSRWGNLAISAGISNEAFAGSAQRLSRALYMAANGGKSQSAAFQQLGIDIRGVTSTSDLMMKMADSFSKMEDGPKKTALAMQLMGRAGANMLPILNGGSKAIEEQMALADQYGANVSEDFIAAGLAVDNAMDEMTLAGKGLKDLLFEALAPAIAVTAEYFNDLVKEMIQSYRQGGAVKIILELIAGAFKVLVTVMLTVGTGFKQLWHIAVAALQGILGTIYSVGSALKALLSGDFSQIGAAWRNGMAGTGRAMSKEFGEALDAGKTYRAGMQRLWSGKPLSSGVGGKPGGIDVEDMGNGGSARGGRSGAGRASAEAKRQREEDLRNFIEDINYKQELAKDNFEEIMRLEDEKLARIKAIYGEDSREYTKALRDKEKKQRQHNEEIARLEQQRIQKSAQLDQIRADHAEEMGRLQLENDRQNFAARDQLGDVSGRERIEQERVFAQREQTLAMEHENRIYNIKSQSLRDQLKLQNLPLQEQIRINAELEQLELEHQNRVAVIQQQGANRTSQINNQLQQQTAQKWQNILSPIEGAFNGFLGSMLTGSQTFKQAMVQMLDSILVSFVQMGVRQLFQWLVIEKSKTAATAAGVATRTSVEATGAATSNAISIGSALKQIAHKAAVAAAGAYAAIASIPVVGPFLAPAAAAAALFGVMKLASSVFSAEGGWGEVPYDGAQTVLHKKEMVLPAKYADPLRNMLTGAGPQMSNLGAMAAAGGADARQQMAASAEGDRYEFNYRPEHTNMSADFETLLRTDGQSLRKWLKNEMRNGTLKMRK